MKQRILSILISVSLCAGAQNVRVDPPHWFTGMHHKQVQLMLHGDNIGTLRAHIQYPGVRILRTTSVQNPNYLFLDVEIDSNARPGEMNIELIGNTNLSVPYSLHQRKERSMPYGLDGADFIYLLMPDRFANGNLNNDVVPGMLEAGIDRNIFNSRHGGDLTGVIQKLDYLSNLGVTATWLTPPLENNQPAWSYHGYAITDHYAIDPRMGTEQDYRRYVQDSHAKGMQVVFDVVLNHVGNQHYFIQDLPSPDWLNQWDGFTRTNYRTSSLMDMYASDIDKKLMTNGWFDHHMPDLNQSNPMVVAYLTQWAIWWIEEYQVDAFRIDTYSYSDQTFLSNWAASILKEYPAFTMFAEVWVNGMGVQGYYNGNNNLGNEANTHLSGVLDFELNWTLGSALTESGDWNTGVGELYLKLAQDYMYGENGGQNNVTFLDNHDMSRFYRVVQKDLSTFKMGVAILLTMRGIPHWFYGSEILMDEAANPMDSVRIDFPGGWPSDGINKFTSNGRTTTENEVFDYISTIAQWRKKQEVFKSGHFMHYVPENGVYVYFRYNENQCVMVVVNNNQAGYTLSTQRFYERLSGYKTALNIVTGEKLQDISKVLVEAKSVTILECYQ